MSQFKNPSPNWQNDSGYPSWDNSQNLSNFSGDPNSSLYEGDRDEFESLNKPKKPAEPEEQPKQKSTPDASTDKDPAQDLFGVSGPNLPKYIGSAASWAESDADLTAEKAKN
jgi:hypothetical protein